MKKSYNPIIALLLDLVILILVIYSYFTKNILPALVGTIVIVIILAIMVLRGYIHDN